MEVLTLNGRTYVKASKAARDLGYASDYVGQLCRSGSVDAHLVGRTWYVNPDTLGAHRMEKKRNARVKAREHARKSIEEARSLRVQQDTKSFKNIAIRYEGDAEELIPEVRKVAVEEHLHRVPKEKEDRNEKGYTIENENKKVILSGTLTVEDAELEEEYTDTVVLTPRIIKKRATVAGTNRRLAVEEHSDEDPLGGIEVPVSTVAEKNPISFAERVAALSTSQSEGQTTEERSYEDIVDDIAAPKSQGAEQRVFGTLFVLLILGIVGIGVGSLFVASKTTYTLNKVTPSYTFDSDTVLNYIANNKDISAKLGNLFK
jgi:hypothetical protein